MNMALHIPDLVVKFATKILKEELYYLLFYEKNIKNVDEELNRLELERQKWGDRVEEEKVRHGREIYPDVTKWLTDAGKIIDKYKEFQKEEEGAHVGCADAFPANLLARHFRSRRSIELKEEAQNHLLKTANFNMISHGGPPSVDLLSNVDYQSLSSRDTAMTRITNALKDSSARMIGVHGPSGVGKTTLVMQAVKDLQEKSKLFDVVIVANVTKTPNIRKIQDQIADMRGIELVQASEEGRASRIRETLKKKKKSTLIILDDVSAKVDLNILGIPWQSGDGNQKNHKGEKSPNSTNSEEEKPEQQAPGRDAMKAQKAPEVEVGKQQVGLDASSSSDSPPTITLKTEESYKGCKVLLISEAREVLNQMDVSSELVVPVSILDEKDAMFLFNKMAGIGDKSPEFGDLAAQIVKKCDGLPMSIVTNAKGLKKNQNRLFWEETLQKLETQTWGGIPEHSTQLVYNLLENKELKITFLLCACMDNDALVSDLVRLCVGLGFLPGISTVKETRTRVQEMLMKLKESGLLSNSYSGDRFTMQNLVRTSALSIASKERHTLMLNKGKIDEWPNEDEDELKRYVAISLRHCNVTEAITKSLACDKLKILEINNDDPHLKLPKQFFKQMKELKVLILTGVQLSPLGSSIGFLTKLRMLCLEQCTLIPSSQKSSLSEELRVIKRLKILRILSFSGSNIDCLPLELGDLSNLQTLDISNCLKLKVIPPNVISRLTSLEELYMRNTPFQWQPRVNGGENGQRKKASLSELRDLNQLTNLDIQIESVDLLPKNLFFDKLSSYKIVIGSSNSYLERGFKMPEKHELSMLLAIHQKGGIGIHAHKAIKMLFERVEYLLLGKLNGVQDLFHELNLKGFPRLKYLAIQNNHEIKFLIHPPDMQQPLDKAFEKLETLLLYKVTKIEKICFSPSCPLSKPSFKNLKTIKINLCEELKYLFSSSMLELLTSLETIQASDCDSLEKIVHVESTDESKTLMLPKMRTLKLQSLPEFSGFVDAITPPPEGIEQKILFHEKVEVSKLERLELRWIQINQIWSDKSSDFGNLIHLDVSGCHNLKYLLPYSLATNLKKLQSLYVSECYNMKNIFIPVPHGSEKVAKGVFFSNLKNIKLSRMSSLENIWSHDVSVEKLDTLVIEKCNELVNVFRPDMEGIFQRLSSLTVTNCKSMETIFDLTADDKKRYVFETILKDVHLESLPKLKRILRCQGGHEGTLQLKSLENITVQHCNELASIFPFSITRECQLGKLQCLVVSDCSELKEIVAAHNSGSSTSNPVLLEFPDLTIIKFSKLPKLENFCSGDCELKCGKLYDVSIGQCGKLELFRVRGDEANQATTSQQTKPLLNEEVMNNLRSMHIELQHTNLSIRYGDINLEVLRLSMLKDTKILYDFLHSNPNLKSLWLDNCSFGKLVEPESSSDGIENKGFVPNLKTFKLTNLPFLNDIGFEHDAILQRIESLVLENCPVLKTVVPSKVSVCFTFLTTLEVVECTRMEYVMPLSTAKSLGQLVTMKVINCESLEEIILSDHEAGEESEKEPVNIVFKQMKTLELISLKKLTRFCSSKSYTLEFPLLEKLVVSGCPKMERFSREEIKTTPTIMKKVYVVRDEEKRLYWEGGIQATIQHIYEKKKYFEGMDKISASEHSALEECWKTEEKLDKSWFYSLKTLTLEGCKFESCAIPSSVLGCLKSLKELKVRNCRNITFIFEMNGIKGRFQLEKLALQDLPNVTHVWPQPDKQNDRRFNNLQQVTVKSCRKLKSLFPVAIATNLGMLEQLELRSCDKLLEIVEKDRHGDGGTKSFVFFYLKRLGLYELPQLTHFYDGGFTLVCPELEYLYLFKCNKFRLFQTPQESSNPSIRPALFSKIEDISKVATISMRSKDTSELNLWLNKSGELGLKYLTELMLALDDDDVKNDYSTFPFEILHKTPELQRVSIINSASLKKMLFPSSQNPKFLEHLKCLTLHSLFKLRSIGGLEHLENLEELIICQCPLLKTINGYPSNLKNLKVEACHKLKNLITSSAARTLKHLEFLKVYYCKSLKEIVRKEQGAETATEEIILEQLKWISLEYLESLECFYPVNIVLKLPSLAWLKVWECPKMTFFSQKLSHHDPSRKIRVSFYKLYYKEFHYHQLNTAVRAQFLNQTYLVLKDYPEMQGKWVGSSGIPVEWSFNYLKYLMVEDCEFLRNAVIPSHLVPLLRKLESLTVKRCKNVKAIFDVKDTPSEHDDPKKTVTIPLSSIFLEELPILTDVWNNDPRASLNFPSLEKVYVWGCNSIKSLFPASVPRDNLQQLDVRNCGELKEIVVKYEAFTQDASILFPRLAYLALRGLPKLRSICSGMHSFLDCFAALKRLYVYRCPMFKVFAADIQYSNPEVEDNFATDDGKHSFVSSAPKDIISNFEELELSKEEVIMIQNKLLSVDLQNLKYLGLNNFNDDESDEFLLDAFLCTNMQLPKLTELQLVDCAFKDIFRPKGPGIDYSKLLSQLKYLEITNLHKLSSMGFEQPWMAPLLQNLETLYISECNRLANLASSSAVSFFYLTRLDVESCAGLKYLFTSSTAKSLGALKKLSISKCESLEAVVVHEKGDKPNGMVLFSKLSTLSLNELPQLECFYTGNSTLYFPSLYSSVYFTITKCSKMKTFSHGEVLPKFMHGKIDEFSWYSDLNAAVQKQFEKARATAPMTYMDLLPTERSLLLLSFVMLGQSANGTLKKKQRRTLELPCPPEYNENTSG